MPAKSLFPTLAACGVAAWLATGRVSVALASSLLPAVVVVGLRLFERSRR